MTLIERIDADLKEAMKAKDELTLSTLRLVRTSLKNKQIEIMRDLTEEDVLAVMRTMVKQYKDAFADFTANGRKDLADRQAGEIAIIERFLPQQMDEGEAKEAITAVIGELGAASMKDMGKVMAALKERFAGKMDFSKASAAVKELLTAPK